MNKRKTRNVKLFVLSCLVVLTSWQASAFAQTTTTTSSSPTPVPPVANPCTRFTAGSVIHNPPALFSANAVLTVRLSYQATTDSVCRQLFSFLTPNSLEPPTRQLSPAYPPNTTSTTKTP